jgi:hypothetical protein
VGQHVNMRFALVELLFRPNFHVHRAIEMHAEPIQVPLTNYTTAVRPNYALLQPRSHGPETPLRSRWLRNR